MPYQLLEKDTTNAKKTLFFPFPQEEKKKIMNDVIMKEKESFTA